MEAKDILHSLQDHKCRSYSGRGMYGKQCFAVTGIVSEILEDICNTARYNILEAEFGKEAAYDALTELMTFSTDTMGRNDIVMYWPSITWEADEGDEEEDED